MAIEKKDRALGGAFSHLQEFGVRGYQLIPGTAALTGRLVLWAPSAMIIDSENKAGRLNFSSSDLLKWVDSGLVQVAARHEWVHQEHSRKNGFWQNAPWIPHFDATISKWAREDANIPDLRLRRVIGLDTGSGFKIAKEAIETNDPLIDRVAFHLSNENFTPGMLAAAKQDYK
jgi:hypothetical protein